MNEAAFKSGGPVRFPSCPKDSCGERGGGVCYPRMPENTLKAIVFPNFTGTERSAMVGRNSRSSTASYTTRPAPAPPFPGWNATPFYHTAR